MLGVELLAVALLACNFYDTIITDYILQRGGRERNPAMRALYSRSRTGFYVVKNSLVVGVLGLLFLTNVPTMSVAVVLGIGVLLIGGACVNNTIVLLTSKQSSTTDSLTR